MFSVGKVLITPITQSWSLKKIEEINALENKEVFINFNAGDEGRSRTIICKCPTKEMAANVANALNELLTVCECTSEDRDCQYCEAINSFKKVGNK